MAVTLSTGTLTRATATDGNSTNTTLPGQTKSPTPTLVQNLGLLAQLKRQPPGSIEQQAASWEPPRSGSASGL